MSLQGVKAFYQRLADDENFRNQIQKVNSKEECSQIVREAGYNFTQQEYEEYTIQLLESDSTDNELKDLEEQELEAVFGGVKRSIIPREPIYQPMYGLPYRPDSI
jgi:predicted ribosomally synthesized peptide with nif11-like leader